MADRLSARAWARARAVVRRERGVRGGAGERDSVPAGPSAGVRARPVDARGPLVARLERGTGLDDAVLEEVRALAAGGRRGRAQAIGESLRRHPETDTLGRLATGIVAYRRGDVAPAWAHLRDLPSGTWARFAPAEHVRSGLAVAPEEGLASVRRLVADDPPEVPAEGWYEVLAAVFGYGAQDLAREVFAIFDRHVDRDRPGWADGPRHRDWLQPWVAADAGCPSAPAPPDGRPVLAVMDYGHPGAQRASANIGDHIQSIASLAHVVRDRGVRLHGNGELVDLLTTLRDRLRPELGRDGPGSDLEVMTVHRDASMYQAIPEGTWVLCFGWYMHALFAMRHGFPLHRNLRPIFVSFHCNKRDLLTPEAVAYLKRHGPVGCRDWTTVRVLAAAGIPAFFSGCLTTTIDAVFPGGHTAPPDAPVAYVDVPEEQVPPGGVSYGHSSPGVRERSFIANTRLALDRLDTYRGEHSRVVTSRLHCHLPMRAIGVPTEFRPVNPADVRLDGLIGISDEAFEAIRSGLTEKLDRVLHRILARGSEDEVYGLWRELTAAEVLAAEEERRRPVDVPAARPMWERRVGSAVAATVTHPRRAVTPAGGAVHCAVLVEKRGGRGLPALLDSLVAHAGGPLHLWVLSPAGEADRVARSFPELTISEIPVGSLGRRGRRLRRLLLPGLVPEVERLVLLPVAAVATADVAELAGLDLGPHAVAAPLRHGTAGASGFGVVNAAANRLRERPAAASDLRRTSLARHRFDFDAFRTDVMVLDLERLRRRGFVEEGLALADAFDLDDAEVLHLLTGPNRVTIAERWAAVPTRSPESGPGLCHWSDPVKPWDDRLTPGRELWHRHAVAF